MRDFTRSVDVVIDTNQFVSGVIIQRGRPFRLLELLRRGSFHLIMSSQQRDELTDVLSRPDFLAKYLVSDEDIQELFTLIDGRARIIEFSGAVSIAVRDHDDVPILASAMIGEADFLITGDKDLLVLAGDDRLGTLQIVTVAEFLNVIDADYEG